MNFIAGVNPLVVFIGIPVLLYGIWHIFIVPSWRNKNTKAVLNHILAEFFTLSGNCYEILCKEERGEVIADKVPKGEKIPDNIIRNPNRTDIGYYHVIPDFCFNTLYPANMPKAVQVVVKKAVFLENFQMPQVSFKPDFWTPEKTALVSAQLAALARDEATLRIDNEFNREVFKDLSTVATSMKTVLQNRLLLFIVIGLLLVVALLVYQNGTLIVGL